MIREFHSGDERPTAGGGGKGRRTPPPGSRKRATRPWHVTKKPKPFGLSQTDLAYLKANTKFDEKEIL